LAFAAGDPISSGAVVLYFSANLSYEAGAAIQAADTGGPMYLRMFTLLVVAATGCGVAQPGDESEALDTKNGHGEPEPPMMGAHIPRGYAHHGGGGNADMVFHNGAIMTDAVTETIFWGTSWAGYNGDKITGLDSWYAGHGGSNYAKASDEYTGTNGQVGASTSHLGHVVDTSAAPHKAPATSTILAEVCKMVPNPVANGYYAVYTDAPRGGASYCAWHSYGTCAGTPVQFAFFFDLDGDASCDPDDTSGLHSQGLAALANVTGHELSEARTDPRNGGWYDTSGGENGDKCAWTFGAPLVTLTNGTQWKVQGEWSNAAFDHNTGYPNEKGQNGCLGGE
jgi:hypothetical protein